jgi:hypothetical protein
MLSLSENRLISLAQRAASIGRSYRQVDPGRWSKTKRRPTLLDCASCSEYLPHHFVAGVVDLSTSASDLEDIGSRCFQVAESFYVTGRIGV